MWPARCAWRSSASLTIASRRSILRRSDADLAVDAVEGVVEDGAPLGGVGGRRGRSRLRVRAASSSSSWPISASENPASSRRPRMNRRRSRSSASYRR